MTELTNILNAILIISCIVLMIMIILLITYHLYSELTDMIEHKRSNKEYDKQMDLLIHKK